MSSKNRYNGYVLTAKAPIDVLETSSTDPEQFFANYVAQRKPVVFKDILPELAFLRQKWTNEYLRNSIGKVVDEV